MADDDNEPDPFPAAREPPPRALTRLSPLVRRLVAPNPSPFTFNGTCTYIVGRGAVAIVDPGPDDDSHLEAMLAAVEGEKVETILITHTHRDHSPGAKKLRAATGARVVGAAPFTPRGEGRRASTPPMTATIRPTRSSPTASGCKARDTRSKPSPRPAIAPIICASRFSRTTRCSPAIT